MLEGIVAISYTGGGSCSCGEKKQRKGKERKGKERKGRESKGTKGNETKRKERKRKEQIREKQSFTSNEHRSKTPYGVMVRPCDFSETRLFLMRSPKGPSLHL